MGVRGLKSFLEREKQVRPINIGDEIDNWKKYNLKIIIFLILKREHQLIFNFLFYSTEKIPIKQQ